MRRANDADDKASELVGAYVDGIAELDVDERARVERLLRDDPAARADADATRALIGKLRELPRDESAWVSLEQQIRTAVGPAVPRLWWQRWRWVVPIGALAATAAIALLWFRHPSAEPVVAQRPVTLPTAPTLAPPPPVVTAPPTSMLWLDGEAIDVGDVEPSAIFDDLDQDVAPVASDSSDSGILPATDLGWIDTLDDSAIDRAETWLARHHRKKS